MTSVPKITQDSKITADDQFLGVINKYGTPTDEDASVVSELIADPEQDLYEKLGDMGDTLRALLCMKSYDSFARHVEWYRPRIADFRYDNDTVKTLVLVGLQWGIANLSGSCALQLGALYYTGEILDQDYEAARDLFEMAASLGKEQAVINLGYIYEYGRTGEPDHTKAYQQYAYAAVLFEWPEAYYKLGDMYSRGKAVKHDIRHAFALWNKSLEKAEELDDIENQAQAAIRIAPFFLDPDRAWRVGVEVNAMKALKLYQTAEIGLRISIDNGCSYYEKRLQEAIEGQEKARQSLDVLTLID